MSLGLVTYKKNRLLTTILDGVCVFFSVPRVVNTLAHANTLYPTHTPCRAAESDPGGLSGGGEA